MFLKREWKTVLWKLLTMLSKKWRRWVISFNTTDKAQQLANMKYIRMKYLRMLTCSFEKHFVITWGDNPAFIQKSKSLSVWVESSQTRSVWRHHRPPGLNYPALRRKTLIATVALASEITVVPQPLLAPLSLRTVKIALYDQMTMNLK